MRPASGGDPSVRFVRPSVRPIQLGEVMTQQLEELSFTCGSCGKQFRWKPELAGKSVKCKCETTIRVPDAAGGVAQPKAARAPGATVGSSPPSSSSFATGVAGAARAAEVPPRVAPANRTPSRAPAAPMSTTQAPPPPPAAKQPR